MVFRMIRFTKGNRSLSAILARVVASGDITGLLTTVKMKFAFFSCLSDL
jgi:hypothetical protein